MQLPLELGLGSSRSTAVELLLPLLTQKPKEHYRDLHGLKLHANVLIQIECDGR